ncbi:MAG: DUF308 domain-containing protein [Bacteroides sp.]|nr:DUF308 domain-containing protein [Bacteroides sp.]MCM1095021.1 DUF308 domain-containing protein [Terasakiella sp.]
MKGRNLFLIGLLVLVAGVVLIILHKAVTTTGIVITGGVLFILAGLLNMAVFLGAKPETKAQRGMFSAVFSWVSSAAAVILGLAMLIFEPTFAALVAFMFGVLIAFGALYQFFLLAYGCRPARLPGWLYVIPTALAAGAVYLFIARDETLTGDMVLLITGVALAVFGLATAVEGSMIGGYNRARIKEARNPRPLDSTADTPKAEAPAAAPAEPAKPLDPSHDTTAAQG